MINRGYSGYTSATLLADLPEILSTLREAGTRYSLTHLLTYLPTNLLTCLSTLREADVIAVTVGVGSNDACVEGCEGHVPVSQASYI